MGILDKFVKRRDVKAVRKVCAIIPAAGSSNRMGDVDKLLIELYDIPVLVHTLRPFDSCDLVDEIIIVCREQDIIPYGKLCSEYDILKVTKIIKGGETRMHSVLCGVNACDRDVGLVAIHDAARPFVSADIITQTIVKASTTGCAAPCIEIKDTIKKVENHLTIGEIDRHSIVAMQTPQVFDKDLIKCALDKAIFEKLKITDDCGAVEALGMNVPLVDGSHDNIKITTPEDVYLGQAILLRRQQDEF